MRETHCEDNDTFRKRVKRCRTSIERLAAKAGDPAPSLDAAIENQKWHGYRLNPDYVRIVAETELSMSR